MLRRRSPGLMLLAVLPFLAGCDLTAQQMPPSHPYFVFFAPNSAALDGTGRTIVADAAAYAKVYPLAPIAVTGYGDPAVGAADAARMARLRADALVKELTADGVDARRIAVRPPAVGADVASSQAARRGDIVVGLLP